MVQTIQLYHTYNGPCPYRSEGNWENISFEAKSLPLYYYEELINQGFRRSGCSIYHPYCQFCQLCIPIRINSILFHPSKGQRRTWRKNQDLRIVHRPAIASEESFELYKKYQIEWHRVTSEPTMNEFENFLIKSPVQTEMIFYYLEKQLIGIGWVDQLESILSSVYFIFDPEYASRRLGVYSVLYEIEYCRQLGFPWLYLGYWVPDSPKMKYKGEYQPSEILIDKKWIPIENYGGDSKL